MSIIYAVMVIEKDTHLYTSFYTAASFSGKSGLLHSKHFMGHNFT